MLALTTRFSIKQIQSRMADRGRELPLWMSNKEKKQEKDKDKVKAPLKSRRKPKVERSVFYCMNEKELVGAAISYLATRADLQSGHQAELSAAAPSDQEAWAPGSKRRSIRPAAKAPSEESPGPTRDRGGCHACERGLDVAEAETLPYAANDQGNRDSGNDEPRGLNASKDPTEAEGEEDDAHRLVREIFFT